jgi:predicted MFS family arabinose efflux permease
MIRQLFSLTRDQRLMFLSGVFWGFGMSMFLFIQPLYVASLGATPTQIGLALGLGAAVVTVMYIPLGVWADRRGRKPVILLGWGLGTVATLGLALAPDWRWVIPLMGCYMLANFAMPAFHGYIAASSHGDLSRTMAVMASGSSLASIVAPALGGWIGETYGLRSVYFCAAALFALSTTWLLFLTPQPAAPRRPGVGLGELTGDHDFLKQVAFILLLFFAIDVGMVLAPKFMEDVRGWTVGQIGWLGTVGSLGVVIISLLLGNMRSDRPVSLLLAQAAVLAAVLLIWVTPAPLFTFLAFFVHGNNRVVRPIIIGRLARILDPATLSVGYGFYETAMRLGLALSPALAGLLYQRNPYLPLYAGAAAITVCLVLTLTLPRPTRKQPVAARPAPGGAMEPARTRQTGSA